MEFVSESQGWMNPSTEVRVGVIGVGFGQHVLVPAVRSDRRAEVVALAASSLNRARQVADRIQVPQAYGGWAELIEEAAVDAVCIAVPPALQPEIACAAASAGVHIFCEKPLAVDLSSAELTLASVRAAGVTHGIDFEFREIPAWQLARQAIQEGRLGRIRHAALAWRVETRARRFGVHTWKLKKAEGGGTLNQFGSHSLDYLEWLFGRVARVSARISPDDGWGDARVDAWLEVEDGTSINLSVATDAFRGTGHRLEVYGEEGTLLLENPTSDYVNGFSLALTTRADGTLHQLFDPTSSKADGRINAVGNLFSRFLDAATKGQGTEPNLEDAVRVQHLISVLDEASRSGTWQS